MLNHFIHLSVEVAMCDTFVISFAAFADFTLNFPAYCVANFFHKVLLKTSAPFITLFNHLAHFAAAFATLNEMYIASHAQHSDNAIATAVTTTSTTISSIISSDQYFAFSSLRFHVQYHLISL
jgi:hypothetical protein